jgi:hypothetical protein
VSIKPNCPDVCVFVPVLNVNDGAVNVDVNAVGALCVVVAPTVSVSVEASPITTEPVSVSVEWSRWYDVVD